MEDHGRYEYDDFEETTSDNFDCEVHYDLDDYEEIEEEEEDD